jgi:hypothetical protein
MTTALLAAKLLLIRAELYLTLGVIKINLDTVDGLSKKIRMTTLFCNMFEGTVHFVLT